MTRAPQPPRMETDFGGDYAVITDDDAGNEMHPIDRSIPWGGI